MTLVMLSKYRSLSPTVDKVTTNERMTWFTKSTGYLGKLMDGRGTTVNAASPDYGLPLMHGWWCGEGATGHKDRIRGKEFQIRAFHILE